MSNKFALNGIDTQHFYCIEILLPLYVAGNHPDVELVLIRFRKIARLF